jgi:hypothetical protein
MLIKKYWNGRAFRVPCNRRRPIRTFRIPPLIHRRVRSQALGQIHPSVFFRRMRCGNRHRMGFMLSWNMAKVLWSMPWNAFRFRGGAPVCLNQAIIERKISFRAGSQGGGPGKHKRGKGAAACGPNPLKRGGSPRSLTKTPLPRGDLPTDGPGKGQQSVLGRGERLCPQFRATPGRTGGRLGAARPTAHGNGGPPEIRWRGCYAVQRRAHGPLADQSHSRAVVGKEPS